jgi:hypothetical protein
MSKKIENRPSYDAPPPGFVRKTVYIHKLLFDEAVQQAAREKVKFRDFLETALLRRIKYANYIPSPTRESVFERQQELRCRECPLRKAETRQD